MEEKEAQFDFSGLKEQLAKIEQDLAELKAQQALNVREEIPTSPTPETTESSDTDFASILDPYFDKKLTPLKQYIGVLQDQVDQYRVSQDPDYSKFEEQIERIRNDYAKQGIYMDRATVLKEMKQFKDFLASTAEKSAVSPAVPHVETTTSVVSPTSAETELDRMLRMSNDELDKMIAEVKSRPKKT